MGPRRKKPMLVVIVAAAAALFLLAGRGAHGNSTRVWRRPEELLAMGGRLAAFRGAAEQPNDKLVGATALDSADGAGEETAANEDDSNVDAADEETNENDEDEDGADEDVAAPAAAAAVLQRQQEAAPSWPPNHLAASGKQLNELARLGRGVRRQRGGAYANWTMAPLASRF